MGACLECSAAHRCRNWVAAKSGTMLAGFDGEHDLIASHHS